MWTNIINSSPNICPIKCISRHKNLKILQQKFKLNKNANKNSKKSNSNPKLKSQNKDYTNHKYSKPVDLLPVYQPNKE